MKAHFTRFGRAALCATALLLAPSAGQAAVLLPGTTVPLTVADILIDPVAPGDVEASGVDPFSNANYSGSLTAAVIRNAGGTLDFYYQITNDSTSDDSLARSTDSNFALVTPPTIFTTEVFYRTDDAGLAAFGFSAGAASATPVTADRGVNGRVVGFSFFPPVSSNIDPGETSRILVIRTNATNFTTGFSTVSDGLTENLSSFQPAAAAIPEPASLLLLSSAFGAAGYMARRRARRGKPSSA
jgi:hypothetical protein